MPVLKRIKFWLVLIILLPASVLAEDSGVFIENLKVYSQEKNYLLDADVTFQLSQTVEQALRNGVALVWVVQIKVWKKRKFLWDTTEVVFTDNYRIRYYALLNKYQIMDEQSQTLKRFNSLRAALTHLGKLRGVRVIAKKDLKRNADYDIGLQIALDKERLPLPLRTTAYISSDWSLSSQWQRWALKQ